MTFSQSYMCTLHYIILSFIAFIYMYIYHLDSFICISIIYMYVYHLDSFRSLCSVLYVLCLCIPSMGPKLEIKHLLTYLLTRTGT